MNLDITFDFTTDTKHYWDNFWENNSGLGAGRYDPDIWSDTLKKYHQMLWSKQLPNGETMDLVIRSSADYLTWKDFRFGSDSITASFRYHRYRYMLNQLSEALPDYRAFMENYIGKCYTIGGTIIFPKHRSSMNQDRGTNRFICDRWDLTLECIRRYYRNEPSPLEKTLKSDHAFFSLFGDFKGYIDYFLLQDCVSPDYTSVVFWLGDGTFKTNPLPETVDEYLVWIDKQLEFVRRRNARIAAVQP